MRCFGVRCLIATISLFVLLFNDAVDAQEKDAGDLVLAELAMHDGRLADSERILLSALDTDPNNDRVRFQLGIVQVLRAIENLGKAMYEYGAVSENAAQPFLRIPVPENTDPSTISYRKLGRILDLLAFELGRAEKTLAEIKDDEVVLPLKLAPIQFDFSGQEKERISLLEILEKLNGQPLPLTEKNPEFLVHFDRGDVAWLRAYCHLLSGMVEAYRSADEEAGFADRVGRVFPKIDPPKVKQRDDWYRFISIVDAPRLRRMRLHFVAVCELNRETWLHIRKETDDEFEWLPHPKQTDQLGMPISDAQIDAWLRMMDELEGLLKGERLITSEILQSIGKHPKGQGLNVAKLLDNPPADLFNMDRLNKKGIDPIYLEDEDGKEPFNIMVIIRVLSAFDGPFGFFNAARMN